MILRLVFILLILANIAVSQNNIIIFSSNAGKFNAQIAGNTNEGIMQQEFKFIAIEKDTLDMSISTEGNLIHKQRLYLLQKAKPVKNKEFVYSLELNNETKKLRLVFMGVHDLKLLPDPLLPAKPAEDTTYKWRNNVFGTLFELKEGKAIFYFNLKKDGECKEGMTAKDLEHATTFLGRVKLDFERYNHAQEIVRNNCITCKQLATLINTLKFELDKLKLVKDAYVNIADKNELKILEPCFRFESSKKEFAAMLSDPKTMLPQKNKVTCTKPEKDTVVIQLASEIKLFSTDYERYRFMKEKATLYCFSSVQFKSILNLFIHDREKLDLTKLFYNNITDKESLDIIKEVFSYNESVVNLENFLKSN